MKNIITDKLEEIEEANNIKMLFACESGSRGWEFPSPDSDYDVRFIYVRPSSYYLSVEDNPDHLEFPINDELDIYGWDIRKVLRLIKKSNTTPFEWLQSPIIYRENETFKNELWALCQDYFHRKSNINHYLGIATGALDTITNGNEIKIKKLFYILRPLLSAKWCAERNEIAPMTIGPLLTLMPIDLKLMVEKLIELKSTSAEAFTITIDDRIKSFITEEFEKISESAKNFKKEYFEADMLNDFFRKTIKNNDY